MYTRTALLSLLGATTVTWLIVGSAYQRLDLWNIDPSVTAGLIFVAACLGAVLAAAAGVGAERDGARTTSDGGCLLYLLGFLGALIPVVLLARAGGPSLYFLLPIAGLCMAATATRSGLNPLLGLGLLAWLALVHTMRWWPHPFNLDGLYTAVLFVVIFLGCGFIRSRVDWVMTVYTRRNRPWDGQEGPASRG